jgi:serine/threonine protein kinase
MSPDIDYAPVVDNEASIDSTKKYEMILRSFKLHYKMTGYYWQVGEMTNTQGWIIHLSVIISQIKDLFERVIPILVQEKVAFKIVRNLQLAEDLLNGHFGLPQIGKIVVIYPENDTIAAHLAKKLISTTNSFKGPAVRTDAHLGSIVYTRYGSFNPLIKLSESGVQERYIYDAEKNLIKDSYSIPFQLPDNIRWPFKDVTGPIPPSSSKLLNHVYKLVDVLKADPRGTVFRGLYVKWLFHVKLCVIKQGISNMNSDLAGRDIQDRLIWQNELYKELSDIVPMPAIYDLFREDGSIVLVMEFIRGHSLLEKLALDNPFSKSWQTLTVAVALRLLKYTIEISKTIDQIHQRGYVHRDIVPVNFLINKKNKVVLIDIELAYSLNQNRPNPPFSLGTFGFMSPEQMALQQPTIKEDIYGLGATLLYTFTGIFPIKFNTENTKELFEDLNYIIGNKEIARIIASCLQHDPKLRPTVSDILEVLTKYQAKLKASENSRKPIRSIQRIDNKKLIETITAALNGLASPPIIVLNDLWYSKHLTLENYSSNKNLQYAISPGISEGLAGILYVLARIHKVGISIVPCKKAFDKGWKYLVDNYFNQLPEVSPGLYKGAAGLALALSEAIRSGLLDDTASNKEKIKMCLDLRCEKLNLADGIAGQGLCHLLCKDFLPEENFRARLAGIVGILLCHQKPNGLWSTGIASTERKESTILNIGDDDMGVIWFLLEYISIYPDTEVRNAVTCALDRISSSKAFIKYFDNLIASKESYEQGDGGNGCILLFTKAYKVLDEHRFRKLAEIALARYPVQSIHSNFTQQNGLAGIGELFLEAWQTFKNEEWKHRADWIANIYIHTIFKSKDDAGHWVMEQNNPPTADFLTGNSGIIHFLARCLDPSSLGYRLLN